MLNLPRTNFRLAIKTALAGCLGMYFASLLRMPQPYWAAISAMIVMQINLGAAVKQSWIRFAATAVGAGVSIPFMAVPGQKLFVFGVAVFVTVVLCTILHLEDGIRLAAVTIAIIMLVPNTGRPWVPALNRFLEVSFGILIALAEKFLQLDTFLSALLLRFRGENVIDVEGLRASLATLARQNTDFHAHGRYEPARWSARRITLVKLLQHEERMSQAVETLDVACDGAFCGGIDLQWEPEFSELCAGISEALQRIAEGILTQKFWTPEYDFATAIQALDARANAARDSVGSGAPTVNATPGTATLEGVLRQHTVYFALQTLARELAAAQVTAREIVPEASTPSGTK
jgi:hypothetical protein